MKRAMPNNRPANNRRFIIIGGSIAAVLVALVAVVAMALTGSDSDSQPDTTATGGATAETTQTYLFMAVEGEKHGMLEMLVGPQGQFTGTHTRVSFSDYSGREVRKEESFGGQQVAANVFQFEGLSDNRDLSGTLENGILTLDGTFSVPTKEWKQIDSKDEFETAVTEYAESIEGCEDDGYLGCDEDA